MSNNGGNRVIVLYKITNSESDLGDPMFNAFPMTVNSPKGLTLASVKQSCAALRGLNHLGAEGYHWRVCVEDKPAPGEAAASDVPTFSWWDIQDENAKLPVKQASQNRLSKLFAPPKEVVEATDAATKAARGAFKSLGKAMSQAVSGETGGSGDEGPPVPVVAFKLLDLVKLHDDFAAKHPNGRGPGHAPASTPQPKTRSAGAPPRPSQPTPARYSTPNHQNNTSVPRQSVPANRAPAPRQQQAQPEASLMDFGPPSSSNSNNASRNPLQHSHSAPPSSNNSNETRAERLKRQYAQKNQSSNRVWDDVDQRWVEVERPAASNGAPKKKERGISLDGSSAVGKSASVQAAVNQRVNEMKESQQKALKDMRDREESKKKNDAEEDEVRKRLEPVIKAWSEEHGKKKQLRALLASLHTILWPDANWKQISIGDILDDGKVKKNFHKASRVVHPDKTHHLDAEKRFLAKRIFDSLSQAKTEFDEGKR